MYIQDKMKSNFILLKAKIQVSKRDSVSMITKIQTWEVKT